MIKFLSTIFWDQNVLLPPFFILLTCTKRTFTNFYLFLPTFILLLPTFTTCYHLSPTCITFHQLIPISILLLLTFYYLSPTLYCTLTNRNCSISFFLFHPLTCTNPTILLNAMLQALILCLSLFLHALCCLLCLQAISLIWIIISESTSSKFPSSRLNLLVVGSRMPWWIPNLKHSRFVKNLWKFIKHLLTHL